MIGAKPEPDQYHLAFRFSLNPVPHLYSGRLEMDIFDNSRICARSESVMTPCKEGKRQIITKISL